MEVLATDMFPYFRQFALGASQDPKPRYTLERILPRKRNATIRLPVQESEGLENDRYGRVNVGPMLGYVGPRLDSSLVKWVAGKCQRDPCPRNRRRPARRAASDLVVDGIVFNGHPGWNAIPQVDRPIRGRADPDPLDRFSH